MNLRKYFFKEKEVTFQYEGETDMINATKLAKPFNKQVNGFLRLKETNEYILLLEARNVDSRFGEGNEVLRVVKGGNDKQKQGTWMTRKLALKFAGWLSPEFELWVYDRIEELLTDGVTTVHGRLQPEFIRAFKMLCEKVQNQEIEIEDLRGELNYMKEYFGELEQNVSVVDEGYYTISGFCKKHRIKCPLPKAQKWGREASLLSRDKFYKIKTRHDAEYDRVGCYHEDILNEVILGH